MAQTLAIKLLSCAKTALRVNSIQYVHKLVSGVSGFPKDLLYGVSQAHRPNVFGDDSYFIACHRSGDVLGVADGVGGWKDYGVDPGRFSRSLMRQCARLVTEGSFDPCQPKALIADGYRKVSENAEGSSTACVVVLDRLNSRLHAANLGDSGFLLLRDGRIVHRSREQQHYFNTPYQLSACGNRDGDFLSDSPDHAECHTIDVKEGDFILLATDGLFDNMSTDLIEKEIRALKSIDEESIQQCCQSLALQARRLMFDENYASPFEKKARQFGISNIKGGKPDDICILLAVVTTVDYQMLEDNFTATATAAVCSSTSKIPPLSRNNSFAE